MNLYEREGITRGLRHAYVTSQQMTIYLIWGHITVLTITHEPVCIKHDASIYIAFIIRHDKCVFNLGAHLVE